MRKSFYVDFIKSITAPHYPKRAVDDLHDIIPERGMVVITGTEAHAFARRLHDRLANDRHVTITIIEPATSMPLIELMRLSNRLDGLLIVVASHLWATVQLWKANELAPVIIHATAGTGFIIRGAPDDPNRRMLDAVTLKPLSPTGTHS